MPKKQKLKNLELSSTALKDLAYWQRTDPKKVERIHALIEAILENHEAGIGKPERLKYDWEGLWSRRIDHTHRILYMVQGDTLFIAQMRFHY